jgi:phage terminase small subunit
MSLTPKQEAFCLAYLETGNASEAYRLSYAASGMSANSIGVEAAKLLDNPKIAHRLSVLQEPIMERHNVTVDSLLLELEEARQLALQTEQTSTAVSATMGKAKLCGLDKQIIETTHRVVDDGSNEW